MPPISPPRGRIHRFAVAAVIAGFVAIVVGPPLATYLPMEVAKWYLAAAQQALNEAENPGDEQIQKAEQLLRRAEEADPGVSNTVDYIRIRLAIRRDDIWPGLLAKIRELTPEGRRIVVLDHANLVSRGGEYATALQLIEEFYPQTTDRDAELNNLFAYLAAEADTNLDDAAASIELAVQESPNSAFLDTQAWVLYRQGRFEAALPIIQRAIRERYREYSELPQAVLDAPAAKRVSERLDRIREDDILSRYAPEDLLKLMQTGELNGEPDSSAEVAEEASGPEEVGAPAAEGRQPRSVSELDAALAENLKPLPEVRDGGDLAKKLFDEFAVFRYHRAEILRGLGRPEIAALEYEYLRANGIEDPAKLH